MADKFKDYNHSQFGLFPVIKKVLKKKQPELTKNSLEFCCRPDFRATISYQHYMHLEEVRDTWDDVRQVMTEKLKSTLVRLVDNPLADNSEQLTGTFRTIDYDGVEYPLRVVTILGNDCMLAMAFAHSTTPKKSIGNQYFIIPRSFSVHVSGKVPADSKRYKKNFKPDY